MSEETTVQQTTTTTQDSGKTFTQADLDAAIEARLARERKKYEDYNDLKTKAAKLDEIEKANLSEAEKLKAELEAAKAEGTERLTKAEQRLLKAEVKAQAAELGIVDAEAALALMDKSEVKIGEDDEVSGVKEALGRLLEAKPWLKKQGSIGTGTNAGNGNDGTPTLEQQLDEAVKSGNFPLQVALRRKIAERKG